MNLSYPCPACREMSFVLDMELVNDIYTGETIEKCINPDCPGKEEYEEAVG